MASGSPLPRLPPRDRRIHPLRWPLIILTFPFSLLAFLLQTLFGWLPTARLVTRRRLVRLALVVIVFWVVVGQLTMFFDRYSAMVSGWPPTARATMFSQRDEQGRPVAFLLASHECSMAVREGYGGGWGDWPFGRSYVFLTACSTEAGSEMLRAVGADALATRWEGFGSQAMTDWLYYGRISWSYLALGVGAYLQLVLLIPWLIYIVVANVATRLRWES